MPLATAVDIITQSMVLITVMRHCLMEAMVEMREAVEAAEAVEVVEAAEVAEVVEDVEAAEDVEVNVMFCLHSSALLFMYLDVFLENVY